jgi:hypothetical protein
VVCRPDGTDFLLRSVYLALLRGIPGAWRVACLIAFTFLPALFALQKGQIQGFMLLGTLLFLMWTQRQAWWLASLSMLFITIKPHILYLVPLAFLFWVISKRRWGLLLASGTGICLATCAAMLLNPFVIKQYFYAISHDPPTDWTTPTVGGALRCFLGPDKQWLQFVPTASGVIWFCSYWMKRRLAWNWPDQMPLLVMVSVLTSAYGWTHDNVVLIPVILPAAVQLFRRGLNRVTLLAIALYLTIKAVMLWLNLHSYNEFWYMWLTSSLAGWYFLVVRLESA